MEFEVDLCEFPELVHSLLNDDKLTNLPIDSKMDSNLRFHSNIISYTFAVKIADQLKLWDIQISVLTGEISLIEFVNAFNRECAQTGGYLFAGLTLDGKLFLECMCDSTVHIFETSNGDVRYIGDAQPFQKTDMEWDFLTKWYHMWCMPIIVMEDTPILQLYAELYRKNNSGFYSRDEMVVLQKGIYNSVQDIADTLNRSIQMRGERGGFIYRFLHKNQAQLVVVAAHKQPEPSFLRIRPLHPKIGMAETVDIVLQTGSKFYMNEWMCGIM